MLALQIFANNIVTYICKCFKKFSSFCHLDRQEAGSIFLRKISTFGGSPPSLTVFVWALSFAHRIRKQIHHREDIRIRTHSIKPKLSPLRCKRRKYPQGGILYPLQSPPPRTKSRFYHAWACHEVKILLNNAIYFLTYTIKYDIIIL